MSEWVIVFYVTPSENYLFLAGFPQELMASGDCLLFLKDFIYLLMRDTQRQRHRQREKQAPCRESDVGLYPGSPGSRPGLKAVLNH